MDYENHRKGNGYVFDNRVVQSYFCPEWSTLQRENMLKYKSLYLIYGLSLYLTRKATLQWYNFGKLFSYF